MENCCDEYCSNYGCNQGINCPVRKQMYKKEQQNKPNYVLSLLIYVTIFCFVAIVTIFTVTK